MPLSESLSVSCKEIGLDVEYLNNDDPIWVRNALHNQRGMIYGPMRKKYGKNWDENDEAVKQVSDLFLNLYEELSEKKPAAIKAWQDDVTSYMSSSSLMHIMPPFDRPWMKPFFTEEMITLAKEKKWQLPTSW